MSDIEAMNVIRERIARLYEIDPHIHVNVNMKKPKVELKNDSAIISGVYRYIFIVTEKSSGKVQSHTLQYADVLTGQVEILELNFK